MKWSAKMEWSCGRDAYTVFSFFYIASKTTSIMGRRITKKKKGNVIMKTLKNYFGIKLGIVGALGLALIAQKLYWRRKLR